MINPAQKPPHLNRREALQTVGATVALATAASGLTGAASAATPTINASDRNVGGFWPNGARLLPRTLITRLAATATTNMGLHN